MKNGSPNTRPERMAWWREARFGMFVHYGLYAQVGRNEWVMSLENYPIAEYEKAGQPVQPKARRAARVGRAGGQRPG